MKRKREHLVPLVDRALKLAGELANKDLLFPSPDTGKALSDAALGALIDRMNGEREKADCRAGSIPS